MTTTADRAVVQDTYGGPETWQVAEIAPREPGRGEVRVRVEAAAIDHGTWHLMTGTPWMARPALGLRRPRTRVPGRDLAGIVDAVGPDVEDLVLGDRVVGIAPGTLATTTIAARAKLAPAPRRLSPTEGAALPVSGLTALQAVDAARVRPGQRVLVIGASGGVGHYLVQLADHHGAEVTAVCSGAKADAVRDWGAKHVVDRHHEDPADLPHRFDVVFDIAGGRSLRERRRLATAHGTIVFVGDNTGGRFSGGYFRPMAHTLRMLASRQRYVMLASRESGRDLERLVALVDAGAVTPHLHAVMDLDEAADAMRLLTSGAVVGKVALDVAGSS